MATVSLRQLNRWTLHRQMLLERQTIDAVSAVERLAGMQAQYSPSPYIGLWTRLHDFHRDHLSEAIRQDQVLKATLMRGTLHLISQRHYGYYRSATRDPNRIYSQVVHRLRERGVDVDRVRAEILVAVRAKPCKRMELAALVRAHIPEDLPATAVWSIAALHGDLINVPDDARFGYFGGSRYRVAPTAQPPSTEAFAMVAATYLRAFGPASRADLAQWSGQTVAAFAPSLETLDLVAFTVENGRALMDLADAPRPPVDIPAPVRFLPKWDNLLLAYSRRERVLPEIYRSTIIRKNGDVLPTFLVDGMVAGIWEAPLKGKAVLTLTPLHSLGRSNRGDVETEGERLLAWLRPDSAVRAVRWADD